MIGGIAVFSFRRFRENDVAPFKRAESGTNNRSHRKISRILQVSRNPSRNGQIDSRHGCLPARNKFFHFIREQWTAKRTFSSNQCSVPGYLHMYGRYILRLNIACFLVQDYSVCTRCFATSFSDIKINIYVPAIALFACSICQKESYIVRIWYTNTIGDITEIYICISQKHIW